MSVEVLLVYTCEECGNSISLGKAVDGQTTPYPKGWIVLQGKEEIVSKNHQFALHPLQSGDFCSHACLWKYLRAWADIVVDDLEAGMAHVPTHLQQLK